MNRNICGICWGCYNDNGECECNEQPADYSSMVLANTVKALTGTQSTTMDIPFVSSVKHTNLVTWEIRNRIELEQFFNEHNL